MLVRVKATGQVLDLVGNRLQPMLDSGIVAPVNPPAAVEQKKETHKPVRESAALNRALHTAAQFLTAPFRKPDALAKRF